MWLIDTTTLELRYFITCPVGEYAILSHRWEDGELDFQTFRAGQGQKLAGYRKIELCCQQALKDDLAFAWVDTCCIDKSSSAELSEAINSMYKWYEDSTVCYAYLSDVQGSTQRANSAIILDSKWFTRGWTLQELIAPQHFTFFNYNWEPIGTRGHHAQAIHDTFGIAVGMLHDKRPGEKVQRVQVSDYSIAERMTWASQRETSREEDIAYCLLGIFQVNIPLLYGEGTNAFRRLQEAIIQKYDDESIFTWSQVPNSGSSILALSPRYFTQARPSDDIFKPTKKLPKPAYTITNKGLRFKRPLIPYRLGIYVMPLYVMAIKATQDLRSQFSDSHECTEYGIFLYRHSNDQYCRVRLDHFDYAQLDGNSPGADWYSLPSWKASTRASKLKPRTIYITDSPGYHNDLSKFSIDFGFKWMSSTPKKSMLDLIRRILPKTLINQPTPLDVSRQTARCYNKSGFVRQRFPRAPIPNDPSSELELLHRKYASTPVPKDIRMQYGFDDLHDIVEGLNFSFTSARHLRELRIGFDQDFKPVCRLLLGKTTYVREKEWHSTSSWHATSIEVDDKTAKDGFFKPELSHGAREYGFWIAKGEDNGLFLANHIIHENSFPFYRTKITVYMYRHSTQSNNHQKFTCELTEDRLLPSSDGEEWQISDYRVCAWRSMLLLLWWAAFIFIWLQLCGGPQYFKSWRDFWRVIGAGAMYDLWQDWWPLLCHTLMFNYHVLFRW